MSATIEAAIRAALGTFWEENAIPAPDGGASTVDELVGPVESMTAVGVLATVDQIVGFEVPNTVIKAGGYQSKDEFIDHLTEKVMVLIAKKATGA
jgi:hypothetical protein